MATAGWNNEVATRIAERLRKAPASPLARRSVVNHGKDTPSKYKAVRTTVDGWVFDSKREAVRYQELLLLGHVGALTDLELQPTFPITVAGVTVARYRSDFRYRMRVGPDEWQDVIEDVKSEPTKTPVYRLKKKLVEALYGIQITEVR